MKIYINAQFVDGPHKTRLLSVGMVSECGEFYAILKDMHAIQVAAKTSWMREHVLSRLPVDLEGRDWVWDEDDPDCRLVMKRDAMADELLDFVDMHTDPEFWGWQSAYAYTCIRHLFGEITDRPPGFPAWCGELAAKWSDAGRPSVLPRAEGGHHALEQARWARETDHRIDRYVFSG